MDLNANDLLVFHLNVNRKVGDEISNNNYLLKNNVDIPSALKKLINKQLLILDDTLETGLSKLNNDNLKNILKAAKLQVSGNKNDLINRIINKIDYIEIIKGDLELPTVYKPTDKGKRLLKETEYIPHFQGSFNNISILRAHDIATNNMTKKDDDIITTIYKTEINRLIKTEEEEELIWIFIDLGEYYKKIKDLNNARKSYNLAYYLVNKYNLDELEDSRSFYYEFNGDLKEDIFKRDLKPYFFDEITEVYEQLIFIDRLTNDAIYNLFINDVNSYYNFDEEIFKHILDYLIAIVKKNEDQDVFSAVLNSITERYLLDKKEFEDDELNLEEDIDNNNILKTNFNELINKNINIEVEIDTDSGDIFLNLDEKNIKKLLKDNCF